MLGEGKAGPLKTLSAIYPRVPESNEEGFIQAVLDTCDAEPTFFEADAVSPLAEMDRVKGYGDSAALGAHTYLLWALQRQAAKEGSRIVLHGFDGDTTLSHGKHYLRELAIAGRWAKLAWVVMPYAHRMGGPSPLAAYWAWVRMYGINPKLRSSRLKILAARGRKRAAVPRKPTVQRWELVVSPDFLSRVSKMEMARETMPSTERERHASRFMDKVLFDALADSTSLAAGAGVELRLPFFDRRLVEFCVSLPPDQKLHHGYSRFIMRKAMEGTLPRKVQWRATKSNVSHGWRYAMRTHGREDLNTILSRVDPQAEQWIDVSRLRKLSSQFMKGCVSVSEELVFWRALTLALWLSPSGVEHEPAGTRDTSRKSLA
jgi:asparagine synthase (glutamine-hydrolysing)